MVPDGESTKGFQGNPKGSVYIGPTGNKIVGVSKYKVMHIWAKKIYLNFTHISIESELVMRNQEGEKTLPCGGHFVENAGFGSNF